MTNILPHTSQKKVALLTRAHFVIVASIVLSLASFVAYGALLPSYLILNLNTGTVAQQNTFSSDEIKADKSRFKGRDFAYVELAFG